MPNIPKYVADSLNGEKPHMEVTPEQDELGVVQVTVGYTPPPMITPGLYPATITSIRRTETRFGPKIKFSFSVRTQEKGVITHSVFASPTLSPGVNGFQPSTLYKIAKAVMKQPPSEHEGLPLRQLLYGQCRVHIDFGRNGQSQRIVNYQPMEEGKILV